MKKMKKFVGIALATAIGFGGLGMFTTNASAEESKNPVSNVQGLASSVILEDGIFAFPNDSSSQSITYNISSSMGDEVNFWLDNTILNTDLKFKVYTPNGKTLYPSKVYTSGADSYKLNVNLNSYGYGNYKVKIYSPSDTRGGEYGWKVRVF
ncbi:hypothetical protein [Bacillus cereus]|uniref:hypothetical protein n=1 Tax=Bacillus TaxID=1386 RepID=UPI0030130EFF